MDVTENVKRLREVDENVAAIVGSKRGELSLTATTPWSAGDAEGLLPAKRKKDETVEVVAEQAKQATSSVLATVAARALPTPTTGKVFHIFDNDELRRLVSNEDNLRDASLLFLAHARWSATQVQEVIDDIHLHSNVSALPIYTVDVDDVDDAGELLHVETLPLPVVIMYHFDHNGAAKKVCEKKVNSSLHLHAVSLVEPVHSVEHLALKISAANARDGPGSFTIVYYGASWCPPCMRILQHLPEMLPQLPKTVSQFLKADKDTCQPLFDLVGVQIIPTFQVIRNTAAGFSSGTVPAGWKPDVVDSLQSSNPVSVSSFIERHCAVLTFSMDDDF